jgi:cytochrome c oxidase cbb3-type subunit IV
VFRSVGTQTEGVERMLCFGLWGHRPRKNLELNKQPSIIMYKEVLSNIDHIGTWPLISFVIFFTFFICLLWWVFSVDKSFVERMSKMPLVDERENSGEDSKPLGVDVN